MQPATHRLAWTCPDCGRHLKAVVLPVKCSCGFKGKAPPAKPLICVHFGEKIDEVECKSCGGLKMVDVFACAIHGRCRDQHAEDDRDRAGMACRWCRKRKLGFEPKK